MKIDLYSYCFDNEAFMPFFLNYYIKIADRITFVDNGSTDKTIDIIKSYATKNGPIIRIAHSGMTFWDWDYGLVIRNTIWKDSNYDYIMWADPDEIIYKPDLRKFIEETKADIYQVEGWDMVSSKFPAKGTDILDIKYGTRYDLMDKYLIWNSRIPIESTDAHRIADINANINRRNIKLLHYKYLGAKIMDFRAKQIKDRVPPESYCEGIKGNILKVYPTFVKTHNEYVREIADRISMAVKVI